MNSIRSIKSRRLLISAIALSMTVATVLIGILIWGVFSGASVLAQPNDPCGDFTHQEKRLCIVQFALLSGDPARVEEAIDFSEEMATTGLVPLDTPDTTPGINAGAPLIQQTGALRVEAVTNMVETANALSTVANSTGLTNELKSRAFRTEMMLRSIADTTEGVAQITSNCGVGHVIGHPDDPTNPNPNSSCNQLLPLIGVDKITNENPYVATQVGEVGKFGQVELFPSYSVPLKADLIPPRWSREIPELVVNTDALGVDECSVVFKEIRGLQLRLHLDRWNVVKKPVVTFTEGITFVEEAEPIWSLEWQPAEYVKTWELCNNDGEIVVNVGEHVKREDALNYFWRYYEPGEH